MGSHSNRQTLTAAGLLITLGIIYGDIGTSPLYVLKAIIGENGIIQENVVLGALSCIFWTLTLQTTFKYIILTLRADNNGEGGIFSLYALVRRYARWLFVPVIIGGSTLLADGIITPPISVSSAVEGLRILKPDIPTIPIVIIILSFIFFFQRFGTNLVGKMFGPIMLVWFSMLGILGIVNLVDNPWVLKAINPMYAFDLIINTNGGFWLLGAVFLCTTGAEALYSDLGHCGRQNIQVSWVFVKTTLLLNYFGQGAWLMTHVNETLAENPFYGIMDDWFLLPGIIIATLAAIIASQALISGSFTLVSEAMRLNFWPKVAIKYPTIFRGQLYVPSMNLLLWIGCVAVTLYFTGGSSEMEAAYGLAITMTMLMTTILLTYYLHIHRVNIIIIVSCFLLFFSIEVSFLIANLIKFSHGGWVTLAIGSILFGVMFVWYRAGIIKRQYTENTKLEPFLDRIVELSNDASISKYATHLVFLTACHSKNEIETKIIDSIFKKRPKKADVYWLIHVDVMDTPYAMDYTVTELVKDKIFRVNFRLGFRVEQKISLYFKKVVQEMASKNEIDVCSRYRSLNEQRILADFRFVIFESFLSYDNDLPISETIILDLYFELKKISLSMVKAFGLDNSLIKLESVPLVLHEKEDVKLNRIYE